MWIMTFLESYWLLAGLALLAALVVLPSIRIIGPTEVGLVTKRFALSKLPDDNPIAFRGEPGYQANLLMPGWHFKLWLLYAVEKHPWVQVRAGEIGVVVAQVGRPLPVGAKSAESVSDLNLITNLHAWLQAGGQQAALAHIRSQLTQYEVETRGVYIQDVILPKELVLVLTQREIANQEKATYQMQQEAQRLRIDLEKTKGTADMQAQLAQAQVGVEIATQTAAARKKQAEGEATYIAETGRAKGAEVEAVGLARAKGFEAQVRALGQGPTAVINVTTALAERGVKIMPEILALGGGTLEGVGATLMKALANGVHTPASSPAAECRVPKDGTTYDRTTVK